MELTRKPFLINKALNKFLMASVFSAVAIQLAVMIDAIIVANFIGPDAMSAINVCTPVVAIIVNVGYMVSMGSTLLMSKAIGENNMEHSSHIAAVAVAMLTSIGLLLALAVQRPAGVAHLLRFLYCRLCQDLSASLLPARPAAALHL